MLPTKEDLDNKIDELFKEQIGCERIDNSEKYVIKLVVKWYAEQVIKHCAEVAKSKLLFKESEVDWHKTYYSEIDKESILNIINEL